MNNNNNKDEKVQVFSWLEDLNFRLIYDTSPDNSNFNKTITITLSDGKILRVELENIRQLQEMISKLESTI